LAKEKEKIGNFNFKYNWSRRFAYGGALW